MKNFLFITTLIYSFFTCPLTGKAQDSLLTVEQAVEIALKNNFSILIAKK